MATSTATLKPFKSAHGSVKPYTRHVQGCDNTDDSCNCPKWIYENPRGGKPTRRTLNTPSWAEALRMASKIHEGFNPEIAAARALTTEHNLNLVSVREACQLWMKRNERDVRASTLPQYQSTVNKVVEWAMSERIENVQDITTMQLEHWYSSRDWSELAATTRSERWGTLRSMFKFWAERGLLKTNPIVSINRSKMPKSFAQGPYTDEQIKAIFAAIPDSVPTTTLSDNERKVYAPRLEAFINLLLWTGCDLTDAVQFQQSALADQTIDGQKVCVYRYNREKTNVRGVVIVPCEIAEMLRNVPTLPDSQDGMPFRNKSIVLASDIHTWYIRIKRLLAAAGVTHVEFEDNGKIVRKPANAKQFRHTFAVRQLVKGVRDELVARQLGHKNTIMLHRHYGPFVKERDEAHIRELVAAR